MSQLWMEQMHLKPKAFLHAPKTGGTTVAKYNIWEPLGHKIVIDEPGIPNCFYAGKPQHVAYWSSSVMHRAEASKYHIFMTVRNPFSLLLSWFDFSGGEESEHNRTGIDYEKAQHGFEYLVKDMMDRDVVWPNKHFLFFQAFSQPKGDLIVDHLLHTEFLDDEIADLFSIQPQPHINTGYRRRPLIAFYEESPGLAEEVYECWERVFWLFGYGNDPAHLEPSEADAILYGPTKNMKDKVKYVWDTDTLSYMGDRR